MWRAAARPGSEIPDGEAGHPRQQDLGPRRPVRPGLQGRLALDEVVESVGSWRAGERDSAFHRPFEGPVGGERRPEGIRPAQQNRTRAVQAAAREAPEGPAQVVADRQHLIGTLRGRDRRGGAARDPHGLDQQQGDERRERQGDPHLHQGKARPARVGAPVRHRACPGSGWCRAPRRPAHRGSGGCATGAVPGVPGGPGGCR